jgi:hypothetical protein
MHAVLSYAGQRLAAGFRRRFSFAPVSGIAEQTIGPQRRAIGHEKPESSRSALFWRRRAFQSTWEVEALFVVFRAADMRPAMFFFDLVLVG